VELVDPVLHPADGIARSEREAGDPDDDQGDGAERHRPVCLRRAAFRSLHPPADSSRDQAEYHGDRGAAERGPSRRTDLRGPGVRVDEPGVVQVGDVGDDQQRGQGG
jgi:hypothetical protein